jgi:retinol dehydrogenase 12
MLPEPCSFRAPKLHRAGSGVKGPGGTKSLPAPPGDPERPRRVSPSFLAFAAPARRAPHDPHRMPDPTTSPVAVITGASRGIGYEVALGLGHAGFRVVALARTPESAREVVEELEDDLGAPRFEGVAAELAREDEIRGAAHAILDRHPAIDLLVNNAGVADRRYTRTPEGFERTLAVNHLAPVRLTHALLPALLRAGARIGTRGAPPGGARILNVTSQAHARQLDLTAFEGPKGYSGLHAYRQSKLLNVIHAFDLARRLRGTGVTVNAVHPGLVGTGLLYDFLPAGPVRRIMTPLLRAVSLRPEEGARTPLLAATSPELAGVTATYFRKEAPAEPAPVAEDREVQDGVRLWTRGLIGVDWGEIPGV